MVTATKVEGAVKQRRYTCSESVAITKNTILTLTDPRTAAEVSATPNPAGYAFAGITSMDKEASDGSTSVSAWVEGIFEMRSSGAITAGRLVKSVGLGEVMEALNTEIASGAIVGRALETAADQEIINVSVGSVI